MFSSGISPAVHPASPSKPVAKGMGRHGNTNPYANNEGTRLCTKERAIELVARIIFVGMSLLKEDLGCRLIVKLPKKRWIQLATSAVKHQK